jgi:hypothetical protein
MARTRLVFATVAAAIAGLAWVGARADAPPGRYQVTADTVSDTQTGLTWQRILDPGSYTRANAITVCGSLSLAGGGWRMPSIKELQTLIDTSRLDPSIDTTAFPNTPMTDFWAETGRAGSTTDAWAVLFSDGYVLSHPVSELHRIRCVR